MSPWVWAVWIAVGFTMEMIAVFDSRPNNTLSAFLIDHVPVAWIMLAIVWLAFHFVTRHKGRMRAPKP